MAETDDRLHELRRRWEADPSSRVFLQLAEEYRQLGRISEAVQVLEKGLEYAPNHLSAQVALGRCRLELGEFEAATKLLEQVVEKDPTQLVANKLLVEAYLGKSDLPRASERLDLYALLNDGDPAIDTLRARLEEEKSHRPGVQDDSPFLLPVEEVAAQVAEPVVEAMDTTGTDTAESETADTVDDEAQDIFVLDAPPAAASAAVLDLPGTELADPVADSNKVAAPSSGTDDPFPEISSHKDFSRYLAGLGDEGLFPVGAGPETPPSSGTESVASEDSPFGLPPAAIDVAGAQTENLSSGAPSASGDDIFDLGGSAPIATPGIGLDKLQPDVVSSVAASNEEVIPAPEVDDLASPLALEEAADSEEVESVDLYSAEIPEPVAAPPIDLEASVAEPAPAEELVGEDSAPDDLPMADLEAETVVGDSPEPLEVSEQPKTLEDVASVEDSAPFEVAPEETASLAGFSPVEDVEAPSIPEEVSSSTAEPDAVTFDAAPPEDAPVPDLVSESEPVATEPFEPAGASPEVEAVEEVAAAWAEPASEVSIPEPAITDLSSPEFADPEPVEGMTEGEEVEASSEEDPVEAKGPEAAATTPAPSDPEPPATVTLGQLYLDQGHTEQAKQMFEAVLSRDPEDQEAKRALASLEPPVSIEQVTALDLLDTPEGRSASGLSEKKTELLKSYLRRIRRRA